MTRHQKFLEVLVIALLLYVIFAFQIRIFISEDLHFLSDLLFLAGLYRLIALVRKSLRPVVPNREVRFFVGVVLISLVVFFIYELSSFNRQQEASDYFNKHEKELNQLALSMKKGYSKERLYELPISNDVAGFFSKKDKHIIKLYEFVSYGYGYIYSDSISITKPHNSPGGSPVVDWYRMNNHWYYFSYFD